MDFLIGDLRMHSTKLMFDGLSVSVDSLQCVVDTRISLTSDETLRRGTAKLDCPRSSLAVAEIKRGKLQWIIYGRFCCSSKLFQDTKRRLTLTGGSVSICPRTP